MEPRASDSVLALGPVGVSELPSALDLLARAFRDNPLNAAVIDDPAPERRLRCNLHGMRAMLPVARAQGQLLGLRCDGRLAAALVGAPPGGHPLPPGALGARLRCLLGQGWRVAHRWGEVFEALTALHPSEPHAYLGTLGVDPELQGRGLGRALLSGWLLRLDAQEPAPVYLETDRSEFIPFYERAGFGVVAETELFGARIWCMWRPARTPQNP